MNAEAVGMADAARGSLGCSSDSNMEVSRADHLRVQWNCDSDVSLRKQEALAATLSRTVRDYKASFSIQDGTLLAGELPPRQTRLVQAWMELRRDELTADWNLAINGATLKAIEPLK